MGKTISLKQKTGNIGIIGLGPVGMILAVHLQEAGYNVIINDLDKVKINKIRRDGIRLEGVITKRVFFDHTCSGFDEFKKHNLELLVFCVKTHHMPSLVDGAMSFLESLSEDKRKTLCVMSAQNGIDVEQTLISIFGESNTLRMVLNYAGNLIAPNVVKVTFFNPPNYIASIDDSQKKKVEELSNNLSQANLETKAVDSFEILKRVWEKTILNSSLSALCGIGKFTIKEAMDFPDTMEIVEQVIEEAVEVAEAEKIKFEDNFIRQCLRYLKKAGDHFPSLAGDLINNRVTEIDYFNGKIVEYGRKHYIRTPLNLAFTNMVRAITNKTLLTQLKGIDNNLTSNGQKGLNILKSKIKSLPVSEDCYLGIDLGSAYTKFTIIDDSENIIHQSAIQTLNRDKVAVKHVMEALNSEFPISYSCATGYGRKNFPDAEIVKTEIYCGSVGASKYYTGSKNIIDIGGEDIKVIRCNKDDQVDNFYLNDKCASGTGAFIVEVSERAKISISDMSDLASKSKFDKELNSFCTVFAKTEITSWLFEGRPVEDIARGIYFSIANRISKLRVDSSVPIYLIGGVVTYHPYLRDLIEEKYKQEVKIIKNPQYIVSLGAALIARIQYQNKKGKSKEKEVDTV